MNSEETLACSHCGKRFDEDSEILCVQDIYFFASFVDSLFCSKKCLMEELSVGYMSLKEAHKRLEE